MELNNNREQLFKSFLTNNDFIRYTFEKTPELVDKFNRLFKLHPDFKEIARDVESVLLGKRQDFILPDSEKESLKRDIFAGLGPE